MNIGDRIISFSSIDSTNDFAIKNYERLASGTVVWALQQECGRGRWGRKWESSLGGLWFSIVFKSIVSRDMGAYMKLVSCSIVVVLERHGYPVAIKWPNDIILHKRKLGGLLAEAISSSDNVNAVVVGAGINVNNELPPELADIGITLKEYSERQHELSVLLQQIVKQCDLYRKQYLSPNRLRYLTRFWKSKLSTAIGDRVSIRTRNGEIQGEVRRIHGDSIEIDSGKGILKIRNGDLQDSH
ncbi:MAG: Biotin/acetyl-CoA-carboxylase ligase [Thermotogales bacterium 46_20]|nr:MAG: Biotin/acetyl-CoA-carboxylase ligase [Thermotogales bacterium 46_20]